ncbi:acidic leucine-rich nuclear phosphoprotein 32 family member E-like [Pyrus x bretschneideri]|uniref:acidic leucine-rich nuclear phosphoprotein 32 family member E-like n=1 Tax=Pyrus x bretschneideri TaxID=225117 RepID=UPI00202F8D82|nr:acidic leucine-rich nuclear phosphoprotein 32 family member E-like [Pyrus x bretschneideri]
MHIEKSIFDYLIGTLLNTRKSKDTLKARMDLQDMNIRESFHLKLNARNILDKPLAQYVFKPSERKDFLHWLKSIFQMKIQHRHVWDVPDKDDDSVDHDNDEDDDDYVDENEIFMRPILNEDDEVNIELSRDDVDSESFDANDKEVRRMLGLEKEGEDEEKEGDEEEEENDKDEEETEEGVATCDTDID